MVRRLSTAQARPGGVPQFSQVYFHDPSDTHPSLKQHPNVQEFTPWLTDQMMRLYNLIRLENPYALSYRMLHDVVKNYDRQGIHVPELTLVFNNRPDLDQRRYNHTTMTQACKEPPILQSYLKDH